MRRSAVFYSAIALVPLLPVRGWTLTGREVMDRLNQREESSRRWNDRSLHLTFRIARENGAERVKEMDVYEKRYENGKKKSLVHFLAPAEIRGTGFLQWTDPRAENRQWLYLPQFKRVRRISSRAKSERFAGSDFSYRDLEILDEISSWGEAQAEARLAREEEVSGVPCYLVSLKPKGEAGYTELRLWTSKEEFEVRRIELLDREQGLTKVLELGKFEVIDGISTPLRSQMRNLKKSSRTLVETRDVKYNQNLKDDMFTQRYLEQERR